MHFHPPGIKGQRAFSASRLSALDQHVARPPSPADKSGLPPASDTARFCAVRMSSSRVSHRFFFSIGWALPLVLSFLSRRVPRSCRSAPGYSFDPRDIDHRPPMLLDHHGLGPPAPSRSAGRSDAWPHGQTRPFMGPSLICGQIWSNAPMRSTTRGACGYWSRELRRRGHFDRMEPGSDAAQKHGEKRA